MFSKKDLKDDPFKTSGSTTTIIGTGTHLHGDLNCQHDLRIDGKLTGNIFSQAKIVIGADGTVEGEINGQSADVMGKVVGDIKVADLLNLRGKADIKGDIYTASILMEPQVTFNGSCHMGANVVDMAEKKHDKKMDKKTESLSLAK